MDSVENKKFCCDQVEDSRHDDFCIPQDCCPERSETLLFPSENSCLSKELLEPLEAKIHAANEFLLDVSLLNGEDDHVEEQRNRALQRAFNGSTGTEVSVEIDALEGPEERNRWEEPKNTILKGRVFLAGQDFVLLRKGKSAIIVPYMKVCNLKLTNRFANSHEGNSLIDVDPCLRRCITFQFGKVVSASPELIQIFFKMPLRIHLQTIIDQAVDIRLNDKTVQGEIEEVIGDELIINNRKSGRINILLEEISFIKYKQLS
ncbi:hypothetical protein [Salirhabdus salicampi]|uniref:hypothetical protein n=1 Tax=Salirhabdus salicampi TaxID=476102 RepID=UPI0020C35642|nr:hypothetical protein [Salirhabdus salicampi]MCP8616007.1 hypothetical protein [Salirhabdus salicampi]